MNLFSTLLRMVQSMLPKERGTGQLFFRKQGETDDGRVLYSVVGVVAVAKGTDWKAEHMAPCFVGEDGHLIGIGLSEQKPPRYDTKGVGSGTILTMPIWRH